MCVICICEKRRPTKDEIKLMWDCNPDGAGVGWNDGKVQYLKGIMHPIHLEKIIARIKLPMIVHFRQATSGSRSPLLTHPFLVGDANPLEYGGDGKLLFHNGHWGGAEEKMLEYCIMHKVAIPDGDWSDTRILAYLMQFCGQSLLKFVAGTFAVLDKKKIVTYGTFVDEKGILVSNIFWKNTFVYTGELGKGWTYPADRLDY